ncbi:MAG: Gfo/Idh/MocA family oxidoreductase [Proteobacteria bacterium]|nr:Gfo/Idh/MocA family oxidoreductase [Pseudomonadota bacterium]
MAVVGVGHFGLFHAEKIAALACARLVAVADTDPARAREAGRRFGVPALGDAGELIGAVDAVSVVVPTLAHFEVASRFLDRGVHVLVEKPIAHDLDSARRLVALAEARGAVLQVGHLPRFYAVTEGLKARITRPLYIECVRIAPFKPRGTDVNVILDLMIHDLDLVLSLVEAPLISVDAAGAPVLSPSEDIASARLKFADGCIASITASRISLKTERKMRIFQPDSYVTVDFDRQRAVFMRKGEGWLAPGIPRIESDEQTYEEGDALRREIESFVAAARAGRQPAVSGRDGLRALEAAIQVTESLRAHARLVEAVASAAAQAPAAETASAGAGPGGARRAAAGRTRT